MTIDETILPPGPTKVVKQHRLLRPQAEMLAYDKKWGAARGGTRAGKSHGWAYWLFFKRVQKYPLANHIVVGADYDQLRRGFFELMVGFLERTLGWEDGVDFRYVASPTPIIWFMRLGKRVRLRSLSTKLVQRIRGMSIQTLVLEEPQTWGTKELSGKKLFEILVGRLSHSETSATLYPEMSTQGRMSFNPPAEGTWLYELIEVQWKEFDYHCWRMSVRDNYLLLDGNEYVQQLLANIPKRNQASEIDGHWSTGGGEAYYSFNPNIHGHPPEGIPDVDLVDPSKPILWTHDFNVKRMCSLICQWHEQTKTLIPGTNQYTIPVPGWQENVIRVLDEFALENSSAPQVLEEFCKSRWFDIAMRQGIELDGDASGGNRSQTGDARTSARSVWLTLKDGLRSKGIKVTLKYTRQNPRVRDRVNYVNAQFMTEVGPGVTIDIPKCPVLCADLRELGWDKKGNDLAKIAGQIGDASDALGYPIARARLPKSDFHIAVLKNR